MNHKQQLLKYSKKTQVLSSALNNKNGIIHKIICQHKDLVKDKRDYLRQKLKPEGHKNLPIPCLPNKGGILIKGSFNDRSIPKEVKEY